VDITAARYGDPSPTLSNGLSTFDGLTCGEPTDTGFRSFFLLEETGAPSGYTRDTNIYLLELIATRGGNEQSGYTITGVEVNILGHGDLSTVPGGSVIFTLRSPSSAKQDGSLSVRGATCVLDMQNTPTTTQTPTDTPTTPTPTPGTPTPSETPSETPTETPTGTPDDSPTPTQTPDDSPTPTQTPDDTPTPTQTPGDTPTPTQTPEDTPTETPEDTPSESPEDTPTEEPTPTP